MINSVVTAGDSESDVAADLDLSVSADGFKGVTDPTPSATPTATSTFPGPSPTISATPAPGIHAATLTISCSCTLGIGGPPDPFRLRIVAGTLPGFEAPFVACEVANSLVDCNIDCSSETPFGCEVIKTDIARQILDCINTQSAGAVTGTTVAGDPGVIFIESIQSFYLGLCSPEMLLPCDQEVCHPLNLRPKYNLCDGIANNEAEDDLTCGLGFEVESVVDATPTPQPTPTETPTVPPFNCVQAGNIGVYCSGQLANTGGTVILRLIGGQVPSASCGVILCEGPELVSCTIDCADETPFDCETIISDIASTLEACINSQAGGQMIATTVDQPLGRLFVQSETPFYCCLCAPDDQIGCGAAPTGWPIGNCPIFNLCDGVAGNEETDFNSFTRGLGFECVEAECPAPTATPTPTDTEVIPPTVTPTPGCDSGLYMLVTTGQIIRVGNPILITGGANFPNDFAKDIERATADAVVSPPTADLVLLDGSGVATFVENPADNIAQSFNFPASIQFPMGRAVDLEMSQSSEGLWVLTDFGGIYRAGDTKAPADPALVPGTDGLSLGYDIAYGSLRDPNLPNPGGSSLRAVALGVIDVDAPLSIADGFIVIDSQGGRYQFEGAGGLVTPGTYSGAPANDPHKLLEPDPGQGGYVWPFFPGLDVARDIEIFPLTQEGAVVFDGWGGVHPVPVNDDTNAVFYTRNEDPILHTPITTVGMPYIVDGFDDPETGADEGDDTQFGIDAFSIFVDFEFSAGCPDGGFYTLDKNGGVFVFGTARPNPSSTAPAWPLPDLTGTQNGQDIELFASDETEAGEISE
jgi:hypothetical protein